MIYVIATTPMKPENKDDFIKGHKACTAETLPAPFWAHDCP